MFGMFSPAVLIGGGLALAATFGVGFTVGSEHKNAGIAAGAMKTLSKIVEVSVRREVNYLTEISNERQARVELITAVEKIDKISDAARDQLVKALATERDAIQAAQQEAAARAKRLRETADDVAEEWKAGRVPESISCGVFNGAGCAAPYPPSGADTAPNLAVRDGRPVAAANPNSGLPGVGKGNDQRGPGGKIRDVPRGPGGS